MSIVNTFFPKGKNQKFGVTWEVLRSRFEDSEAKEFERGIGHTVYSIRSSKYIKVKAGSRMTCKNFLRHFLRQNIRHDVDGVSLCFGRRCSGKQDLQQSDHVLRQWRQHRAVQSFCWSLRNGPFRMGQRMLRDVLLGLEEKILNIFNLPWLDIRIANDDNT